jgi:hypothetical protein
LVSWLKHCCWSTTKRSRQPRNNCRKSSKIRTQRELYTKHGIEMFERNRDAVVAAYPGNSISGSLVILELSRKDSRNVLDELKGFDSIRIRCRFYRRRREDRNN